MIILEKVNSSVWQLRQGDTLFLKAVIAADPRPGQALVNACRWLAPSTKYPGVWIPLGELLRVPYEPYHILDESDIRRLLPSYRHLPSSIPGRIRRIFRRWHEPHRGNRGRKKNKKCSHYPRRTNGGMRQPVYLRAQRR